MKTLRPILTLIAILLAVSLRSTALPLFIVDTNGVIQWPTNFFGVNISMLTNALNSAGYSPGGGGGSGTVTSVGFSAPTGLFYVTGSPVTTSGTLGIALTNQAANTFLSGPTNGSPATPDFRVLADADIPAAIARDSEVTASISALSTVYQPLDADLTALAAGTAIPTAITNSASVGAPTLYAGTTNVASALAVKQPLDSNLTTLTTLNGGILTNLNAGELRSGTVPTNRLAASITGKLDADSPAMTGTPTVPTAADGTSNTVAASTAFVMRNRGGGGSGNANTNASTAWADLTSVSLYDLTVRRALSVTDLDVGAINFSGIWGFPNGGLGVTNAADARVALNLVPDVDIQTFRLPLLQLYVALGADGDMPYRNSSGIVTNVTSTSAGRTLLAAASAAAQRAAMGVPDIAGDTFTGAMKVPYETYSSGWTNNTKTNEVPTKRAIAEKIEALSVGGFIASVDATDLRVNASQLSISNVVGTGRIVKESALTAGGITNTVQIDIYTNTAGATWTKPAGAKLVEILCIGGGGGGGSGRRSTNAYAGGGGGGSGGGMFLWTFSAAELGSSETVTVGTNGLGGVGVSSDGDGASGTAGGSSSVGTIAFAGAGQGGGGGLGTGTQSGGPQASSQYRGASGGQTSSTGGGAVTTVQDRPGGGGGGGGGGCITAAGGTNAASAGGHVFTTSLIAGGAAGTVAGVNGANGMAFGFTIIPRPGSGGGGGYPGFASLGNGGNGGWPGGGGGGGAGCKTGSTSGSGGAGASGVVVIKTYF